MHFNADKTEEVISSTKRNKPLHDPLTLGTDDIERKTEHKHIGMVLDSKLSFQSHIGEAILKARRGIGEGGISTLNMSLEMCLIKFTSFI